MAPIVPDEARTFGLEALIAETKIYAPEGQRYTPVDSDLILRYAEDRKGQVLQEGITEAGAMASFIALSTAYATWGRPMLPIYLFYSMFGFQRVGDLAWLLGDIRGRGILAGCTAGRTTLQGEGLQHDDGHSPLLASVNPAAHIYDPAFAYEIGVIMEDAVTKIMGPEPEDRFWYLTLYNENYPMPPLPEGDAGDAVRAGVLRGMYRFAEPAELRRRKRNGSPRKATLLFSGPMWQVAMEARAMLAVGLGGVGRRVVGDLVLRAARGRARRWSGPTASTRRASAPLAYVTEALDHGTGPVVAVTDYLRAVPDQVARWVPRRFVSLGTDGFGRSDTRAALRRFFEVDAAHVVVAVLSALAETGDAKSDEVADAIARYGIDPDSADPWTA